MKCRISALFLVAALATAVHPSVWAQQENWGQGHKPKLVPFDAPGAATKSTPACAPLCGTLAYANNDFGVIVGYYTDPLVVPHSFVRTPDGHITPFNAPAMAKALASIRAPWLTPSTTLGSSLDSFRIHNTFITVSCASRTGRSRHSKLWARAKARARVPSPGGSNLNHGFVWYRDEEHSCEGGAGQEQ
jgi:hypothetical protein